MSQKNNVEFYFTLFKNGAIIKRSSFSKPCLVVGSFPKTDIVLKNAKGDDLIKGIFYWKDKTEFIFFDHVFQQSQSIAAERENDISRVSFEMVKDVIKIQIRSVLAGAPPKVEIPYALLKPKTEDKKEEKKRHWKMLLLLFGLFLGSVEIFIFLKPFGFPEPKEEAAEEEAATLSPAEMPAVTPPVQKVDKSPFLRVLQKNRGDIEQCQFENSFQNGTVKYRAVINGQGKISELSVLSDDVSSGSLISCLDQKIRDWKFPAVAPSAQTLFFALSLKKER